MPIGWKLWEELALKWLEMSLFKRAVYINMYYIKIYNYTLRTNYHSIECIQVWILLGYQSNIFGYPVNTGNYTSKRKLGWFPTSLRPTQLVTFFNILKKILINIKDVIFDFKMGCILVLFSYLWIINVQFTNFDFLIIKICQIGVFWSKISIIIIEISQKLHLHAKYGWNNPYSCRFGLKSHKVHFLKFLAAQKFITYTNSQIHVTGSILTVNSFFVKCF